MDRRTVFIPNLDGPCLEGDIPTWSIDKVEINGSSARTHYAAIQCYADDSGALRDRIVIALNSLEAKKL